MTQTLKRCNWSGYRPHLPTHNDNVRIKVIKLEKRRGKNSITNNSTKVWRLQTPEMREYQGGPNGQQMPGPPTEADIRNPQVQGGTTARLHVSNNVQKLRKNNSNSLPQLGSATSTQTGQDGLDLPRGGPDL